MIITARPRRLFRSAVVTLSAAALGLGLVAAGGGSASASTPAPSVRSTSAATPAHLRTITHNRSHIRMTVHGEVRVDLFTSVDGGYEWITKSNTNKAALRIVHKYMRAYPHEPMTAGYPYHTYYVIRAIKPGTAVIHFVEWHPWDHSDVADHFTITITVGRRHT